MKEQDSQASNGRMKRKEMSTTYYDKNKEGKRQSTRDS